MTVKMFIDDFTFNVQEITNSRIGDIHIKTFQVVINIVNKFFKDLINKVMVEGASLQWMF